MNEWMNEFGLLYLLSESVKWNLDHLFNFDAAYTYVWEISHSDFMQFWPIYNPFASVVQVQSCDMCSLLAATACRNTSVIMGANVRWA